KEISMKKILPAFGLAIAGFLFFPAAANAQAENVVNQPLTLLVILAAMSLAPFVLVMVTSFVKISVVLSILRNAMGTQQIPPTQVINGMAIILTIYIMYPVGLQMKEATASLFDERTGKPLMSDATTSLVKDAMERVKDPMRQFLLKHCHDKDRI